MVPLAFAFFLVFLAVIVKLLFENYVLAKKLSWIPNLPALPIIGNSLQLRGSPEDFFELLVTNFKKFGSIFKIWIGPFPIIIVQHVDYIQPLLRSSKNISKSEEYNFLMPYIGEGLLLSTGEKWQHRRKMLTPSFHMGILENMTQAVIDAGQVLVEKVKEHAMDGKVFNVQPYIKLCALDVMMETSIGRKIYAQDNPNSAYVKAVDNMSKIFMKRTRSAYLRPQFLFRLSSLYKQEKEAAEIIHRLSFEAIEQKRKARKQDKEGKQPQESESTDSRISRNERESSKAWSSMVFVDILCNRLQSVIRAMHSFDHKSYHSFLKNTIGNVKGGKSTIVTYEYDIFSTGVEEGIGKKRLALLDLLLEMEEGGEGLSNADIQEEVDTFVFEGHDTTSAGTSFGLFLLGHHPEMQDRIVREIDEFAPNFETEGITLSQLGKLEFLERCMKEILRLYPSALIIARKLVTPVETHKGTIPVGITVMLHLYNLHRDKDFFPDPETFDPDRFLPDNNDKRHPFAYVPFSAGPRNCIGQKFAVMEMKILLILMLKHYTIESVEKPEDLTLIANLIIASSSGIQIKIKPRVQ